MRYMCLVNTQFSAILGKIYNKTTCIINAKFARLPQFIDLKLTIVENPALLRYGMKNSNNKVFKGFFNAAPGHSSLIHIQNFSRTFSMNFICNLRSEVSNRSSSSSFKVRNKNNSYPIEFLSSEHLKSLHRAPLFRNHGLRTMRYATDASNLPLWNIK